MPQFKSQLHQSLDGLGNVPRLLCASGTSASAWELREHWPRRGCGDSVIYHMRTVQGRAVMYRKAQHRGLAMSSCFPGEIAFLLISAHLMSPLRCRHLPILRTFSDLGWAELGWLLWTSLLTCPTHYRLVTYLCPELNTSSSRQGMWHPH